LSGLLSYDDEPFMSNLWDTGKAIFTMTEWLDEEDPDPDAPLRSIEETYWMYGQIARTHRWVARPGGMACGDELVPVRPQTGSDEQWLRKMYREIMKKAVMLTATTPTGLLSPLT
jgi:hypothetical protein